MFEIGRLCVKIAGRDAGLRCVVVDVVDDSYVMIDGQTRRRKCNVKHLEPTDKVLKIKKGISHDDILKELKKEGIEVREKQKRSKKTTQTTKEEKPKETVKKEAKKETPEPKAEKKTETKPKKKAAPKKGKAKTKSTKK
jgi:large subunit ribosomal protein L14e